ncbi:MAG: ABC transporter ATP-binding protein [Butyricicoccus sp.]|nr:ABC transporter ATP-binding protein [Butyricicoccus sp.]
MLSATGLTKRYNGQIVLHPASLTLTAGEAVGVAGANGSGKSTLLAILAQTLAPDGGTIAEDGVCVLGDRAFLRQHVGYVPQTDALIPELTVTEQLALWQRLTGRPARSDRALWELLDLDTMGKKPISKLSGGMRKRVSFALALAGSPRYLIMDEAFAALDRVYRSRLEAWLGDYTAGGGALLWCSHEPEELERLCSRVITLEDGQILPAPVCV